MICCSCFTFERIKIYNKKGESEPGVSINDTEETPALHRHDKPPKFPTEAAYNREAANNKNIQAQTFTFRELAAATKNFRQETMLGEGGFGRVYKGQLAKLGQTVAVKQLDRNGMQGNKEFLVEVLMLSLMHHQNLVKLIGYCADGDQRLLVYEFMELGSLEDHLLDLQPEDAPLNWFTRLKIALGAAKGLEYLHDKANPSVIYRDLKSSNILLDKEYNAKLSDFGLAKLGPLGEKTHVSSRVMGTYGYCAPEYQRTGQLTLKSDVYSFGVVLLEIITGRRAADPTRRIDEQNLVSWAEQYFGDPSKYPELVDPLLEENYPIKSLNQVVAIASMCLQEEASVRPLISDVVTALSFLGQGPEQPPPQQTLTTDPILVPPQPVPAPTYDIAPASPPARDETSPVHEQLLVPPLAPPKAQAPPLVAPILAFSKSSPAVLPHWEIQNTIYNDNEQEYTTESDSNSDDESFLSESYEEDHKDEAKEKDRHEEDVVEAKDWCSNLRNDEDENNTESDSNSDDESYESESEEEDHKDEAKEKDDHDEDVIIEAKDWCSNLRNDDDENNTESDSNSDDESYESESKEEDHKDEAKEKDDHDEDVIIEAKDWCSTLRNERQRTSVANSLGLA